MPVPERLEGAAAGHIGDAMMAATHIL